MKYGFTIGFETKEELQEFLAGIALGQKLSDEQRGNIVRAIEKETDKLKKPAKR